MGCGISTCYEFKQGCCCKSCKNTWIDFGRPCLDYFNKCKCQTCKRMENETGDLDRMGLAGDGKDSCVNFKTGCCCKACQSIWALYGRPCGDYFTGCKCDSCKNMVKGMKDESRKGLSGEGNDKRK